MAHGFSTWWMARREKCPPISRNSEVDRGSAGHAEIVIGRADKTAGDGNRLTDVTGDRNAYQVAAADRPVRWVVGNPAGTWQIDISPCVCRPSACYRRGVTVRRRIVEISRHDACPKAKAAGRFDQQDGEVAARTPATVECLNGGLCPLRF